MVTLRDYLARFEKAEFTLGRYDCLTFAVGWVESQSGLVIEPAVMRRVRYTTQRDVRERFGALDDWLLAARDILGKELLDSPLAGDVCIAAHGGKFMLGIVGSHLIYIPAPVGVAAIPIIHRLFHWRPMPCHL